MEIIAEGLGIILSLDEHTGALIIGTQAHTITIPRDDAVNLAVTILGWESLEDSRKAMQEVIDRPVPLA